MSKYECISERNRMRAMGWSETQIDESLAITFRHPTIKRLAGMVPDSPEVSEVDSEISEIVGIVLDEGYTITDSTGTFCDGILVSWTMWFRCPRTQYDFNVVQLDVSSHILQAWKDSRHQTEFKVELCRIEENVTRRSRIEVVFPTDASPMDRYDWMVDTIVPGIERMRRFAAGFIDA